MLRLFDRTMSAKSQIVRTWDVEIGGVKPPLITITGGDSGLILRSCF
jgi:hypothetical protein